MAMDAKEKKKMMIRAIAGGVIVLVILIVVILLTSGGETAPEQERLGPSDSMVPTDPKNVMEVQRGLLVANPNSVVFNATQTSAVVTLLASGSAILINEYTVQPDAAANVTVSSIDCPSAPQPLAANTSCSLNLAWNGVGPISSVIDITGQVFNNPGAPSTPGAVSGGGEIVKVAVPISALESVNLNNQFSEGAIDPTTGQAFSDTSNIPAQNGSSQGYVDQGGPVQAATSPAPSPASIREQQRAAYLGSRQQRGLAGVGGAPVTANARSPYAGWDGIGASGRTSSYPTDMSRVITPDKAITAVLTVPIDTRNVNTAVAMVDRDIYGNNGRTVVIPRGSKLIGTPGVSDSRVGIAWKQLIRPDGTRFVFEGTSGDANGTGGVPGRVNERLLERYGYSLLPTAVAAGITVGLGGNQVTQNNGGLGVNQQIDARAVAAQILQQPLTQIAQDIFQRKSNLPVQITVPAGTRMTVWVLDDLRLKPAGQKDKPQGAQQQQRNGNPNQQGFRPQQNGQQQPPAQQNGQQQNGQRAEDRRGNDNGEGNENIESYGVGTIDENGNYVAPGSRAPAPSTAPLNSQNRRGQ